MAERGVFGNLFGGNCAILFFILVFLLLFDGGRVGGEFCDPK